VGVHRGALAKLAFSTLSLAPAWLENLAQLGYVEMTPIQALALPAIDRAGAMRSIAVVLPRLGSSAAHDEVDRTGRAAARAFAGVRDRACRLRCARRCRWGPDAR
jgi:hypothetical protein